MAGAPSRRAALVLYGSETGNAQEAAEELGRIAQRLRFSTQVLPLDSIDANLLNESTITLIAISTTGQGELPSNARGLWKKLLRKKLPRDHLASTRYALFGLGDSSYPQYNWAALKLGKRLNQLGATEIISRGEADEQHPEGSDASFIPWCQQLREKIIEELPLPDGSMAIADDVLLQPPWLLGLVSDSNKDEFRQVGDKDTERVKSLLEKVLSPPLLIDVNVHQNKRLTPASHFQDVRHLRLHAINPVEYLPGDVLTIYPRNHPDDVDQLLRIMGWGGVADCQVLCVPNEAFDDPQRPQPPPLHNPGILSEYPTFRDYLSTCLDLNAIPRRSFFSLLTHFTNDEFQKERLVEFTNPEYIDELFDYTTRPRRSILEVLQEFDTLEIPWQWAPIILPQLRGRQFSIASGGSLKSTRVEIGKENPRVILGTNFDLLVAIVKYRTVIKKIRRGVCTRYLEDLGPGDSLQVTVQKGSLLPRPADRAHPLVLVGPGTGLAPIRSLIWERWMWQQTQVLQEAAGEVSLIPAAPVLLFFGCRSRKADYFFQEEWKSLEDLGMPLTVHVAFSRDQDTKVYVQDLISQQHELVYKYLCKQDGLFFICGSSGKMPQAVRGALMDAMQKGGGMTPDEAEQRLKTMEKSGHYKQETW